MFSSVVFKNIISIGTIWAVSSLSPHLHAQGSAERVLVLVQRLVESSPKENTEVIIGEFTHLSNSLNETDFKLLAAHLTTCSNSEFYVGMKFLLTSRGRVYNAFSEDQRDVLYRVLSTEVARSIELRRRVVSFVQWDRTFLSIPCADDRQTEEMIDRFVHYAGALVSEKKNHSSSENEFRRTILASIFGYEFTEDEWLGRGSKFEDYLKSNQFQLTGRGIWAPVDKSTGSFIASLEESPTAGNRLPVPPRMESPFPGDKKLLEVIDRLGL